MFLIKWLIVFYVGLLVPAARSYRSKLPNWLLVLYALPVLLCLAVWSQNWNFCLALLVACLVRVLGGRILFGKNHLSHFLSHLLISVLLIAGLFLI